MQVVSLGQIKNPNQFLACFSGLFIFPEEKKFRMRLVCRKWKR
ncbi:hypothetical protein LEP1GSC060_3661 [Leptospira weilii serovar Ranarum str. ICFT]|uniref:Uncharacterized protein n=1 Tax=Leptospira weilii serovar Ranarum str. ICFT TaxID=1218598 RepID=N1WPY9_9LEPT|nr:hypothetical protein LEP1GSC060_3661 [Leptospira weilii serovar Ranarum str. ICFT]